MSSTSLYNTFGNEIKYTISQNTLSAYIDNATIKFALPEESSVLLSELITDDVINPQELEIVKSKLQSIGFQEPNAKAMASILIQVAKAENVSPLEYFQLNETSLKLAIDTYKTINLLRPSGNRIGVASKVNNSQSRFSKLIRP